MKATDNLPVISKCILLNLSGSHLSSAKLEDTRMLEVPLKVNVVCQWFILDSPISQLLERQSMSDIQNAMYHSPSIVLLAILASLETVWSHGRLLEPPARNTLWRFGFKAPPNYNDNELFCGGIGGITRNAGKCGICGDAYDGPRTHETGNMMALNQTVRNYFPGSSIDLMVEIVANHGGHFEFHLCWRDSFDTRETEECFEKLPFNIRKPEVMADERNQDDQNSTTREERNMKPEEDENEDGEPEEEEDDNTVYDLNPNTGTGIYTMSVLLPHNRTCDRCILRWHWRSANNWGLCEDGIEAIGCGHQEVYRNCADISVRQDGAGIRLGPYSRRR